MADDQVKYSELVYNDNDSFRGLLSALESVRTSLAKLKEEGVNYRVSLQGANTATREQQQDMAQDAAAVERTRSEIKRLTDEEARLNAAIAEANRMTKLQGQAANAVEGSLNQMRARYKLLVAEMGNYNLKTEEGRRKMQSTAAQARKLRDEIYKLESAYGQFGRNVGNYSGSLSRFGARLKEAGARFVAFNATFLSVTGLIRFGRALYETRKELESSLVTFKALAGEVQGAKLFEQIKEFAFTTPVTLNAAAKATQTMLSFGVAQDKVVDIMQRLGDISAGDSDRLQRLALAYSQATQAGRLMGQDTLQFINSGFNPLYYISLRTGKSMMELRKEMQEAKIPIDMVTQAIVDATSAGGQFEGMLEKQKETMKGAANIMSGAWQNMLNEMGAEAQGTIVGVLKWLTKLMQNWRDTIKTIKQVAVSIGVAKVALLTYRMAIESVTKAKVAETAATVAETATTNAETAATLKGVTAKKLWAAATTLAGNAMKGLMGAMKSFAPFAIISGLTFLIQKLYDAANASKRAAEEVRQFEESAAEGVSGTISQYQQLAREWKQLGDNQEERALWIKEHKRLFDELGLSIKDVNEADRAFSEEGTKAYINAVKRRAIADAYKDKLAKASIRKQELEDEGRAYQYVTTTPVMGRNINTGEPVQLGETNAYGPKTAEYLLIEKEIADIEKKIEEFEQGAAGSIGIRPSMLPPTTEDDGGSGGKKDSGPKEQNIVDKYWEAERALLEAQYQGYQLELKLARLNRDKAQDERINWYVDQRLALDNNLKNGFITEQEYDARLQELDRQNTILRKSIEEKYWKDTRALRSKNMKAMGSEWEKNAKENAKAELKAMADGWQEQRAKLVEQGASRRKLIDAEVTAEIARLNMMLELNRTVNGEIMSDEEKAKVEEWIVLLEKIQKTGKYNNIKPGQIAGKGAANVNTDRSNYTSATQMVADVLGVDLSSEQISALNSVFDQAKAALNSWMDARKAAADQAKELADDEVSSAEQALNREIELRNQGYANDVALREKELADAKSQQKKALEQQEKAKKEELAINTALEASNMAVAVANLFKQFGLYAIPMAAVMLGAWAATKISAFQQINSTKYREGGVMLLEGGSHQSGHDVNLGIGPDGSNLRAEGGEYFAVINKRNSRKYGSEIPAVVNALNSGMFEDKYIKTSDAVGMMGNVGLMGNMGEAVDLSAVESGVEELVRQGESRWTVEGEWRVERYKNRVRRVKVG